MTPQPTYERIVALGDSFTEGMGDERPDGSLRGWADMVAEAFATVAAREGRPSVAYANLAIRGRRVDQIVEEQLDAALALDPDLITFNGGGNDLMRPRVSIDAVGMALRHVVDRVTAAGVHLYLCTGADASGNLPLGRVLRRRADDLHARVWPWAARRDGVTVVDNFGDRFFADPTVWSPDGLHLNARGHRRAAANALTALGRPGDTGPAHAVLPPLDDPVPHFRPSPAYYRDHVLPWLARRAAGRSSGDGRAPKRPVPDVLAPD